MKELSELEMRIILLECELENLGRLLSDAKEANSAELARFKLANAIKSVSEAKEKLKELVTVLPDEEKENQL